MKKIKKVEIGDEIHRDDYRPEVATYRMITITYYRRGQYEPARHNRGCIYPSGVYDDAGNDMLIGQDDIRAMIHYSTPAGVVFENSAPEKTDAEWEKEAGEKYKNEKQERERDRRNGLCPKCGTYCCGDCEA